jgi:hypothetical protein
MPDPLSLPAAILFDEGHGQKLWFSAPPTVDQGFSLAAALAGERRPVAFAPAGSRFSPETLAGCAALVLPMAPQGQTNLAQDEIEAVHDFVRGGGGLLVLGAYTGDWHHEANLSRLIERYGISFNRDVILPAGADPDDAFVAAGNLARARRCLVEAAPNPAAGRLQALVEQVNVVAALSCCSLYVDEGMAAPILRARPDSLIAEPEPAGAGIHILGYLDRGRGPAILAAASTTAKVVVVGSWRLFLDPFLADPRYDNRQFFANILDRLLAGAPGAPVRPAAALPTLAPGPDPRLRAVESRLRDRRVLLAQLEKEVVLAIGLERATLNVHIDQMKQAIAGDEAELDDLQRRG